MCLNHIKLSRELQGKLLTVLPLSYPTTITSATLTANTLTRSLDPLPWQVEEVPTDVHILIPRTGKIFVKGDVKVTNQLI